MYPGHEAYELDETISVVPAKQIPALVRQLIASTQGAERLQAVKLLDW